MITQTDLTRFQAVSSALIIRDIAGAERIEDLQQATARIPQLLVQLVGAHNPHEVVTRLITDIADAVTRRLIAMAEAGLGPPPVPYLWLACGSQGRQEQTGVSDQDNCLIIDNAFKPAQGPWFENLARFVSDGLHACGYVYCPGDMMATNPRWRQPVQVWRQYFLDWIMKPDPTAQMLASVMFDLRADCGRCLAFCRSSSGNAGDCRQQPLFRRPHGRQRVEACAAAWAFARTGDAEERRTSQPDRHEDERCRSGGSISLASMRW